jgi:hypothetical protein
MKAMFIVNDCWEVVSGRQLEPTLPTAPIPTLSTETRTTECQSTEKETPPPTSLTAAEIAQHQEDLEAWREKNTMARACLILYTEDSPRQHIVDLKTVHEQWVLLKRLYAPTDIQIQDAACFALSHIRSSSYESIQEYTEAIMKHQNDLKTTGAALPDRLLSAFYRLGLEDEPEASYATYCSADPWSASRISVAR